MENINWFNLESIYKTDINVCLYFWDEAIIILYTLWTAILILIAIFTTFLLQFLQAWAKASEEGWQAQYLKHEYSN